MRECLDRQSMIISADQDETTLDKVLSDQSEQYMQFHLLHQLTSNYGRYL